jgi:hypothetical protein
MFRAAKGLLLVAVMFVSANAFAAASTGPSYTATLKVNVKEGTGVLTISGKQIDFYTLWNLSNLSTGKGRSSSPISTTVELGVFTSNGNGTVPIVFFGTVGTTTDKIPLTSNANITYDVAVNTRSQVATAKSDKAMAKSTPFGGTFSAVQDDFSKDKFKFVFQIPSGALAQLPTVTKGKNTVPTLTGLTGFILQVGSGSASQFPGTVVKGKIVGTGVAQ